MIKQSIYILSLIALVITTLIVSAGCSEKQKVDEVETTTPANNQENSVIAVVSPEEAGLLPEEKAQPAPEWVMPDLQEKEIFSSEFLGKVVILDFWDTWCPPCRKEIPGFVELQDKYSDKGLVVIGAAFGREGGDKVRAFAKKYKINYPTTFATPKVMQMFGGIQSIPTTFIIDRKGLVRGMHVGYVKKEVFEKEILALL
ncbi:MAG: TlpA disulfide reductase family protein [Candidatus Electryonea clarkiae]|nr:TlpA disulfide reductase family protein [Candidatus Electryonea clarkiae]MDP8286456.1 TlpA disulfide reductase family protein [Candidatus Electryonea clarkiae]